LSAFSSDRPLGSCSPLRPAGIEFLSPPSSSKELQFIVPTVCFLSEPFRFELPEEPVCLWPQRVSAANSQVRPQVGSFLLQVFEFRVWQHFFQFNRRHQH
jgi:hypothetical protein